MMLINGKLSVSVMSLNLGCFHVWVLVHLLGIKGKRIGHDDQLLAG